MAIADRDMHGPAVADPAPGLQSKWCAWWTPPLAFIACAAILSPFFWVIYRTTIFQTVPRDDYAPFLLWLLGQHGGAFPESPYAYRVLSAVAAIPFYELMPAVHLTNLGTSVPVPYLRATAALAALSYLSTIGAAFMAGSCALRCGLNRGEAALAGTLLFLLCWYSQIEGIDPLAILVVALLLRALDRPVLFVPIILVSVILNEKICMVFAIWLSIRWLFGRGERARLAAPWIASLVALILYLIMVNMLAIPGNGYQLRPGGYPSRILENLVACLSLRGLVLDLWPTVLLASAALVGWSVPRFTPRFSRLDILVVLALAALALIVTKDFQMGRIVMHAAPLFVVPAAAAMGKWLQRG